MTSHNEEMGYRLSMKAKYYFSVATTVSCFMFFSNYGKCTFLWEMLIEIWGLPMSVQAHSSLLMSLAHSNEFFPELLIIGLFCKG